MVLELKLPDISKQASTPDILHHLWKLAPYFGAYVFSFMMVGIFWSNHHHMFHLLEKTNEPLLGLNLVFLFWMSLIPFASGVMGANPLLPTSAALYGFIMLMTTLSLALIRWYTLKKGLIHKDQDPTLNSKIFMASRHGTVKSYLGTAAYLLSIPLAFVSIWLAYLSFIIPPVLFFIPHGIDDEKLAAKIEEKN
jgi:uncharacterized membrane protein